MSLFTSTVGKKMLMAVSGLFMVLFVVMHLLGNFTIFAGSDWLNSYAQHLRDLALLVWVFRIFMISMLCLHVYFGIVLTLDNWSANPEKYAVKKRLRATFSGETMIWTGAALLAFLLVHLAQFTFRATPDVVMGLDWKDRFDVFLMVISSLRIPLVAGFYILSMIVLFLHLNHGIQSIFQSLGWNNDRALPRFSAGGKLLSILFLLGYGAIPVLIIAGILAR